MSRSETEYLRHILDEARYLTVTSRAVTWQVYATNETLKRAFVRSCEVIGEATKLLSPQLRNRHPVVDWRAMAGMRDGLKGRTPAQALRDALGRKRLPLVVPKPGSEEEKEAA